MEQENPESSERANPSECGEFGRSDCGNFHEFENIYRKNCAS